MISLNIKLGGVQGLAAEANMVEGMSKLMEEVLDAGKSDGERGFAQMGLEFFQLMRGASLEEAEMALRMVRGRGGRGGDFSVSEGLAEAEMGGVRACVDTLAAGEGDGVLRDTAWGKDIVVPRGRSGKKGYGLEHIQEKRILHGFRPEEAAFIAVCAMKAAQSVKMPGATQNNKLLFDRFGVRAVVAEDKATGNPLITGFVLGTKGKNKAVDADAALNAHQFYALNELRRVQEVGAALGSALARFEGIIKDNPHDWEKVVEWEIEKLKVKQNAKASGTFMRAPNGAETKLRESQWLSVRTGAFKEWFGDWEGDAANASKVVDENGEPMVVYHGTLRSGFTVFGKGEKRFEESPDGAYFFSPNKMVALAYSGFEGREVDLRGGIQAKESRAIYSSFLNMRNPKVVDFGGSSYMHEVYGVKGVDGNEYWKDENGHVFYTDDDAKDYAEEHGIEIDEGKVLGDVRTTDIEAQRAKEEGYDGIIIRNVRDATNKEGTQEITDDDYVAFEPAQIKSATQNRGTYDASNADITFGVAEAKEKGLFRDGVMVAGNGVVVEPGVSFAINGLLHASGVRFSEFDLSKVGSGTGIQIYGFGVYLAQAHDLKHNRRYWEKAKEKYGQAFNYRVSFNADESELVVWDRRTPEALLDAAVSEFGVERDAVGFVDDFYFDLARRFGGKVEGARKASEWLYGHGVKGVKTGLEEDAFIVAFNEGDVRITAVNELDYWSEKEGWREVAAGFDGVGGGVDMAVSDSLAEGVREEMGVIKERAVADGTFMRAPNGAETKLTEGQWLAVRTGAFKDWFGDWENDAANASKVVDGNGEPMVVYHGTNSRDFTVFDEGKVGSGGAKRNKGKNLYGDGFYFATDYYTAQGYGRHVLECFLNIKDPAANDLVMGEGNDGIAGSVPGSRIFVVYGSNQIKSARDNRGTYDGGNADITFGVREGLAEDVKAACENRLKSRDMVELCSCPPVLIALGQKEMNVVTMAHVLRKVAMKHKMGVDEVVEVVRRLGDPELVIQDGVDSFIFIPGVMGVNRGGGVSDVEVPLKVEHTKDGEHYVLSAYPLDSLQKIENKLRAGKLVYSKRSLEEMKEAMGSANGAPGLSPDLVRLAVAHGFSEDTITEGDVVKRGDGVRGGWILG